jgi:hypothetical protein
MERTINVTTAGGFKFAFTERMLEMLVKFKEAQDDNDDRTVRQCP